MSRSHPETISPTAHYTGYVWFAHGCSHDAFATRTGRFLYRALRGTNAIAQRAGWPSLEGMLLARHRLIDLRLGQAIDAGEIQQVVEIAAGLSPRGWQFATRYGDRITYLEADLPGMLAHKQRILAALGGETAHHRTAEIDALIDAGPTSLAAVCSNLDPTKGTAIVTEGLLNYFERDVLLTMWRRFATVLRRFPRSLYLSDLMLRGDNRGPISTGFSWLLSAFVRGRVHMPFDTAQQAEDALEQAGLVGILLDPRDFAFELEHLETAGAARVRIVEAVAGPATPSSRPGTLPKPRS
jgi:O-methyltransferase involved in polyketide biosynthesis